MCSFGNLHGAKSPSWGEYFSLINVTNNIFFLSFGGRLRPYISLIRTTRLLHQFGLICIAGQGEHNLYHAINHHHRRPAICICIVTVYFTLNCNPPTQDISSKHLSLSPLLTVAHNENRLYDINNHMIRRKSMVT